MAQKASPSSSGGARWSAQRVLILLVLVVLALFLLHKMGVPIIWRSESTEIIEHPHR
ncbi:MAG: hypothetical protein KBG02_07860 [Haliscomenobacter sp.]|nr:hypothetical protein [Haliscomenobacter sp.]MBK8656207.1 hypothetical protein [Haliscomenobacter sp.]MBP9076760.1 hypothetical protein [Haliscomenobacter sp.]MBP9872661.1 hypothetical protein [Haliscomenobacter sp.]